MNTVRVKREAMGTSFEVALYGDDPDYLTDAVDQAFEEVEQLEEQLSLFMDASEVCDINAEAADRPVRVEPELFELLTLCQRLHRTTHGAFDITVAPLMQCWGFHRHQGRVPPPAALAKARCLVGMAHVRLDPETRTVAFDRQGVSIDLGGIGKGYAVDRIAESLRRVGVDNALIHAGTSSVYALGAPPGEAAWEIGIRHPLDATRRLVTLKLRDRAASTSGSAENFFEVAGKRYCHVIDPRTGQPVEGMLSATVLTATATEGDALSTALFVLGVHRATEYCRRQKDIEAILVPTPPPDHDVEAVRIGTTR